MQYKNNASTPRGFSLLEMLIVLSIVSVILILITSDLSIFFKKNAAEEAKIQLWRAIQQARSESMARGTSVFLKKNHTWPQGFIIEDESGRLFTFDIVNPKGNLYWRGFPAHHDFLEFTSAGFLKSENGTFWYCEAAESNPDWAIVITQEARARLVLPDRNHEIWINSATALTCLKP